MKTDFVKAKCPKCTQVYVTESDDIGRTYCGPCQEKLKPVNKMESTIKRVKANIKRYDVENRISAMIHELGPVELEIVRLLVVRLTEGQNQFGPFEKEDDRDFRREALEEILDCQVYAARLLVGNKK